MPALASSVHATPTPSATPLAAVIPLTVARADRLATIVHRLYPRAIVRADQKANALVVVATSDELTAIRTIVTGLDVRASDERTVEAISLHTAVPADVAARLTPLFTTSRFSVGPNRTLIIAAAPHDLEQIRAVLVALDAPPSTPTPRLSFPTAILRVSQASPGTVARALARAIPTARIAVAGSTLVVNASPQDLDQAKSLLEQLDRPAPGIAVPALYKMSNVDAASAALVLGRAFQGVAFSVTKDLNAISVTALAPVQQRIAEMVAQLDAAPAQQGGASAYVSSGDFDVVSLHAAVPSANGPSTSANDVAQTVTQALAGAAPDLHITVQPNSTRLVLSGSSHSRELARALIAQLDISDPLVELDTRVYEVDEGAQTQLGLRFPVPALASTFSEIPPVSTTFGNQQFLNLQAITRTPLSLQAQLDFLVSNNKARILEDPRITTFSGHTASLRAGETVNILTTTGGGSGTVATTQVQSFQTGVTLDITPVVNTDSYITVTLHPSVNSIAGTSASGVPNIQTRDTTTTIGLHDGETLIVGGLIEETESKTVQKIPLLGDLPLIGRLFQDVGTNHTRNELVVTVTPHILQPQGQPATPPPTAASSVESTAPPPATYHLSAVATPSPSPSPPAPLPTAFEQTNAFVYGQAPTDNYADQNQPPQIFYARVQPTVVKQGTPVTISAVTTTNVTALAFGPTSLLAEVKLAPIGPGKWQSTFTFDASQAQARSGNITETLTAISANGSSTSIRIPLSLSP